MNSLSKIVFFLLLLTTGCHEKNATSFIPILSVTPFIPVYGYKRGESVITISSNTNWNINSSYSWCRRSLETGNGNTSITIITHRNELKEERQATFYITAKNASNTTLSINQNAFEPAIADSIVPDNTDMRDLTSLELSKLMGIGWNRGNTLEAINITNGVNTVRATGGRNTYRHLIEQSYLTNISLADKYFKLPKDNTENRLFAEIHFYDPYSFTLQTDGNYKNRWGINLIEGDATEKGQEKWGDESSRSVKTNFIDKSIPGILDEYGTIHRTSLSSGQEEKTQSQLDYLKYVTSAAVENEMGPFYLDNGVTGNNGFALFSRIDGSQTDPQEIQAIINYSE